MITINEIIHYLKAYNGNKVKIMEVCGTHTQSIFKNGIRSLISNKIELLSGPGCPVCVTSPLFIDRLIEYSFMDNYCVLTYGDMMRVKGSELSLSDAKARGGNVNIIYSPHLSLKLIKQNPHIQYILAAVGFETTAPIYALLIEKAIEENITNLKLLTSLKTIIPALEFICENENNIDAFLCPGHVSVIIGSDAYEELSVKYNKPFVIAGFEGEHILIAIYEILKQLESNKAYNKNMYPSVVSKNGSEKAKAIIDKYFVKTDEYWRGICEIKDSGLCLKKEYSNFNANYNKSLYEEKTPLGCKCSDVILGRINPNDCPLFYKVCTPIEPVGPCMVSSEGVCGIWFSNKNINNDRRS